MLASFLIAALLAGPQVGVTMHVPPGPDAPPNVRSFVWIPELSVPVGGLEYGIRAPLFNTRFDCRGPRCSTGGTGNPALTVTWRTALGGDGPPAPPRPSGTALRPTSPGEEAPRSPPWWTSVTLRLHAPLADPDLDDGRAARDVALIDPELWPDLTPDALPLVLVGRFVRRAPRWLLVDAEGSLAGLLPVLDRAHAGGGVVGSARADLHLVVAGDDPVALSVFARARWTTAVLEETASQLAPGSGVRFTFGAPPAYAVAVEAAARFLVWHDDPRLPDAFFPGFTVAAALGF